jgi:hypothetical protein
LVVEATFTPGRSVRDDAGGVEIPLDAVTILWGKAATVPPEKIVASNMTAADADLLLDPGRYVLLLGSNSFGHFYLADGRYGAFPFADAEGQSLARLCTEYTTDGKAHAPVRAQGVTTRGDLLRLVASAAERRPSIDPNPSPVPAP